MNRLLVIEPHPITRAGLTNVFRGERDLKVVSEVGSIRDALAALRKCKPDLVIMATSLPDGNWIECIQEIRNSHPDLPILIFSAHEGSFYAERALREGARGFITKTESAANLLLAVRAVLNGSIYTSENAAARIVEKFSGLVRGTPDMELTERELEFFRLLGAGHSTKEIAERMNISAKTVEAHRVNIKSKLRLPTASAVIAFAARWTAMEAGTIDAPFVSGISVSRMSRTLKPGGESSQ